MRTLFLSNYSRSRVLAIFCIVKFLNAIEIDFSSSKKDSSCVATQEQRLIYGGRISSPFSEDDGITRGLRAFQRMVAPILRILRLNCG